MKSATPYSRNDGIRFAATGLDAALELAGAMAAILAWPEVAERIRVLRADLRPRLEEFHITSLIEKSKQPPFRG